jgi:hypothetical protein
MLRYDTWPPGQKALRLTPGAKTFAAGCEQSSRWFLMSCRSARRRCRTGGSDACPYLLAREIGVDEREICERLDELQRVPSRQNG